MTFVTCVTLAVVAVLPSSKKRWGERVLVFQFALVLVGSDQAPTVAKVSETALGGLLEVMHALDVSSVLRIFCLNIASDTTIPVELPELLTSFPTRRTLYTPEILLPYYCSTAHPQEHVGNRHCLRNITRLLLASSSESQMLCYGCTRLEISVQSVYEDVARDNNRGHTVCAISESFHLTKDAGFKVVAHMMPDLPNVGLERDLEQFEEYFENPMFRSDGLKIYPSLVIRVTGLYELWGTGRYKNYTPNVLVDVVARILALVLPWTRVYRVQRTHVIFIRKNCLGLGWPEVNLKSTASGRLVFHDVNLTAPFFGLAKNTFQEIHAASTLVIHNAWALNFIWQLSTFEDVYIRGLRKHCGFCIELPFLPASPLPQSIASVSPYTSGPVPEISFDDPTVCLRQGYASSKYLSEHILVIAAEKMGLQILIPYRPNFRRYKTWHLERDGPRSNFAEGCQELGAIPQDWHPVVAWTPVNDVTNGTPVIPDAPANASTSTSLPATAGFDFAAIKAKLAELECEHNKEMDAKTKAKILTTAAAAMGDAVGLGLDALPQVEVPRGGLSFGGADGSITSLGSETVQDPWQVPVGRENLNLWG
ncbi:hypothetical protein BT96DRAFT_1102610 [Gymnopus androsaceus JB14]|uniref:Uncharacterized protein n=1 Tax=Gymnopus androsaceus JB14 TaxID=1447944 RepID=A0A6A4GEZ1_9AGAR|nr:hypothetical protein BT96DRAFT_1102610 [Gymnopus androsaceus JB14]